MRLHRRAGAARAAEGHSGCTCADVFVCALYALRPSHIGFFRTREKVQSLVRRSSMLYFHGTKHTHTEHHHVTLNHQHIRGSTCLGTWIMCICC